MEDSLSLSAENNLTPVETQEKEMSSEIGALAGALAKAQGEIQNPTKDKNNPFFKSRYADLASCYTAVKCALSKHNVAVVQTTTGTGSSYVQVNTILMHESGQWIKSTIKMKPSKNDPQGVGSALTYARRYGLSAACGIPGDDDDDGNAASQAHKNFSVQKPPQRVVAKQKKGAKYG